MKHSTIKIVGKIVKSLFNQSQKYYTINMYISSFVQRETCTIFHKKLFNGLYRQGVHMFYCPHVQHFTKTPMYAGSFVHRIEFIIHLKI